MNCKWFGAAMVISGCGGFGFLMAARYRREIKTMRNLQQIVEYMICELQYSLTGLPDMFHQIAQRYSGVLTRLFRDLRREMEWQQYPDICDCMYAAIRKNPDLPPSACRVLRQMGRSLGQYDLPGQVRELEALLETCKREAGILESRDSQQLRTYQTLSLCAGVALAILLL